MDKTSEESDQPASTPAADEADATAKKEIKSTPLWAWIILAIAVSAMSSGGIWFRLMGDAPPWLKACWRLTLTAAVQFPKAAM